MAVNEFLEADAMEHLLKRFDGNAFLVFVAFHLVAVDVTVELFHLRREFVRPLDERFERKLHASFATCAHGQEVGAQLAQLGFEIAASV